MAHWFTDDTFEDGLETYGPEEVRQERVVRWITRELYTDIQCWVLEDSLRYRLEQLRQEYIVDKKLEYRLSSLLDCKTQEEKAQWLQDYKGRALLSCTVCLKNDVPAVLELKEGGKRVRICAACCGECGYNSIYVEKLRKGLL